MIPVDFHKRAQKALRNIPKNRSEQIVDAITSLADLADPTLDGNVSMMKGDHQGKWRLRVGKYRVIFSLEIEQDTKIIKLLFVSHIGQRGGIYG